ncbi:MAG: glycosyltransferase family 4 protein [Nitrospirae bacterium]|nr:glycosyltransferase family 4 protein [Nitrospirota bacterium]
MLIWLVTVGEPLPVNGTRDRLHRAGMLANSLIERGHDVVWWSSTFDHFRKKHLFNEDTFLLINERLKLNLLHSVEYSKNVSVARIINHYEIARKFRRYSQSAPEPDIILCSFPTIELSCSAALYGKQREIPVVIDVRDLWPDIFCDLLPAKIRWIGKMIAHPFFLNTRKALKECKSIIGISEGYLQWGLGYAGRSRSGNDAVFPLGYDKPVSSADKKQSAGLALKELGVDPSKTICWFIGTFGKSYDLGVIIEAARHLNSRRINNVQFVFSGNGEKYNEWSKMAEGLDNVIFTGWLDSEKICYMMGIANIGLAAYSKGAPQGLPNKFYEYMCAGLPILSSLRGEAEIFLKDNMCGLTYDAEDSNSFLKTLMTITNNEGLRKEMCSNSRLTFENGCSSDKIYPRMVDYLVTLAQSFGPAIKT